MILFSSLAILSVLLMVGIGARVMLQNDYRVLTNLRGGTEAFYIAAAGLAWSKNEIARSTEFPPAPVDRSEPFGGGSFAVDFLSAAQSGPLSARIVVRATGSIGSASHTIEAQLHKIYDLIDGAVGLRGSGAQVHLSGGPILISGQDHDPISGNPIGAAKGRAAVSTGDESLLSLVNSAASGLPAGSLTGAAGGPAIMASDDQPSAALTQLANGLCGQPTAILTTMPAGGALVYENQAWGSYAAPQLRCIEGLAAPGDGVTLAGGMSGAGILVIRNADLSVTGSLRWEGLIIVTGSDVGLRVSSSGSKEIFGAVIINESDTPSTKAILDIQSQFKLLFSRQSLQQAAQLIAPSVLNSAYAFLPATVRQDYWRTVTP
jgi:hypothetical protein